MVYFTLKGTIMNNLQENRVTYYQLAAALLKENELLEFARTHDLNEAHKINKGREHASGLFAKDD